MARILDGIRVLDFGRYIAAPFCCQLLADMGAEVIRVERPEGEPDRLRGPLGPGGISLYYVALNRNKRGITLNLDNDAGRRTLAELIKHTDVLVHNQPINRAQALGLDYPQVREINPRLISLAVSGFGSVGPYAPYTSLDIAVQALSGAASMTGSPDASPMLEHIPFEDFGTALYGALAVTLALFHRERTGQGQNVDMALFATGLSFVAAYGVLAEVALNGVVRRAAGNSVIFAVGGIYRCREGHVAIACAAEPLWRRLCRLIERPDLIDDPRLKNDIERHNHRAIVDEAINNWTRQRPAAEVAKAMADAGIPVGEVQSVDKIQSHPQTKAMQMAPIIEQPGLGPVPVSGIAMKFSATPGAIDRPAPAIGEHNQEVYDRLLGAGACERLKRERAI
ncbi:MAG: CoA transferase [Candidatus Binataceae bacterium]|jgi:crotonobetainyl-CoA:carnitine CoA-transferase CaiB-like acyl-CoA transferase